MDFQDPTPDFQHQNSPKLQIFWGFNYISSSLYTQLIVVVSPLATIVYFILRAMIFYLFQQIFKISTSSSNSMTLPRKAMHQLPLPSVCLPFHEHILLQQPTPFPRSLPHSPSLTSNNISSLKISLLFLILSLLFQFTIISQFN